MFKPQAVAAIAMSMSVMLVAPAPDAFANGWYESRPWQFDTSADKANKAAVLDMIERKKGGYYDGFSTTINNYSNTNIGTQVNCNNVADATGNEAANSQTANSPDVTNTASIDSSSNGNQADNAGGGKHGGGSGVGNDQSNTGDVSSEVVDSNVGSSAGPINSGQSQQGLDNSQNNSGNQTASVNDSTACNFDGSKIEGDVKSNITGPLN